MTTSQWSALMPMYWHMCLFLYCGTDPVAAAERDWQPSTSWELCLVIGTAGGQGSFSQEAGRAHVVPSRAQQGRLVPWQLRACATQKSTPKTNLI